MDQLEEALVDLGGKYVLRFAFKNDRGTRTSHYLVFACKDFIGYDIMKGVMAKESSQSTQGVYSFSFSPADKDLVQQELLFGPLDALQIELLTRFANQRLPMRGIYEAHTLGTKYISSNYKEALKKLEMQGKIITHPSANDRRKNTFGDDVIVQFPQRS